MKEINREKISKAVIELVRRANFNLRGDVVSVLRGAYRMENYKLAKKNIKAILDNAGYARENNLAICQDTGLPIVFVELGSDLKIQGDLKAAINKGISEGYKKYSLRDSIIKDPISRGKPGFLPPIIHIDIVKGDKIRLTLLPKGFGCENKSQLKMFKPTAGIEEIKNFIVEAVKNAGTEACPPYFVGVGIGGSADYSALLAKKALLGDMRKNNSQLEKEMLRQLNQTKIGPMGLGGKVSVLGLKIEKYPTHIAGLPVSVNISCHALRSASILL